MATCANGHAVDGGSSFCSDCGAPVKTTCPAGHLNEAKAQFCSVCGSQLQKTLPDSGPATHPPPPLGRIDNAGRPGKEGPHTAGGRARTVGSAPVSWANYLWALLGIVGGLVAWILVKDRNRRTATRILIVGAVVSVLGVGVSIALTAVSNSQINALASVSPTTAGSSSPNTAAPPSSHVGTAQSALEPIPASISSAWVQAPLGTPGPETAPVPSGPTLANLHTAATGQSVDGVQCQAGEQTVMHVHTHLTIFVNGQARVIPYGVGIPGYQAVSTSEGPFVETGNCFYWLHTHADDGIIHVESPSSTQTFTLGQFFNEWGIPLSSTQVGPASGKVTAFFTSPGKPPALYTGDPGNLPLGSHYQIQLDVGTPIVAPVQITNWGGL